LSCKYQNISRTLTHYELQKVNTPLKSLEALHPHVQPITTFLQTHYKLLLPATIAPTAYLTFRYTRLLPTDKLLLITIISGSIFLTANMI